MKCLTLKGREESRGGSGERITVAGDGAEPSVERKAGKDFRFLQSGTKGYYPA